jgi:hypothetical protein
MPRLFLAALLSALVLPAGAAARPVPDGVVLAVDKRAATRNFMPTRMLIGFHYASWSYQGGVLRLRFENPAGRVVQWTVSPMSGTCRAGMQKSFQLGGNKVWWAESGGVQRAWRCVFGQDGRAIRLTASSPTPSTKLAGVGLGSVVASGKRY